MANEQTLKDLNERLRKLKDVANPTSDKRNVRDKLISLAEKHDSSLDRNIKSFEKTGNDKAVKTLKEDKVKVRSMIKRLRGSGGGAMLDLTRRTGKSLLQLMSKRSN